jgi:hypothetical protein
MLGTSNSLAGVPAVVPADGIVRGVPVGHVGVVACRGAAVDVQSQAEQGDGVARGLHAPPCAAMRHHAPPCRQFWGSQHHRIRDRVTSHRSRGCSRRRSRSSCWPAAPAARGSRWRAPSSRRQRRPGVGMGEGMCVPWGGKRAVRAACGAVHAACGAMRVAFGAMRVGCKPCDLHARCKAARMRAAPARRPARWCPGAGHAARCCSQWFGTQYPGCGRCRRQTATPRTCRRRARATSAAARSCRRGWPPGRRGRTRGRPGGWSTRQAQCTGWRWSRRSQTLCCTTGRRSVGVQRRAAANGVQ